MREVDKYFANGGDKTHLYNYNLNSDSVVLDIGGHVGELSADMYEKFGCNIYIFEPIKEFYENLKQKFMGVEKIKIFNYGVGNSDYNTRFRVYGESTSEYVRPDKIPKRIELVKIKSFMTLYKELGLENIDVCSINIEGGEYNLLPHIIEEDLSCKIKNFQIQFHNNFIIGTPERRKKIQDDLSTTHKMTFNYDFVWENWELK